MADAGGTGCCPSALVLWHRTALPSAMQPTLTPSWRAPTHTLSCAPQYPAVLWLLALEDDLKTRVPWPAALLGHELGEEVSCVLPGPEGLLVTQLVHYGLRWDTQEGGRGTPEPNTADCAMPRPHAVPAFTYCHCCGAAGSAAPRSGSLTCAWSWA